MVFFFVAIGFIQAMPGARSVLVMPGAGEGESLPFRLPCILSNQQQIAT